MADDLTMGGPHWTYSLAVYSQDGVPSSCLYLQDAYEVDVNILLLGLYGADQLKIDLTDEEIQLLDEEVREFRESVIMPLRGIRRRMKGMPLGGTGETVRNQIKGVEFQAEQLEQALIIRWLANSRALPSTPSLTTTAKSIVGYFARRSGKADELALDRRAPGAIKLVVCAVSAIGALQ